MSDTKQDTPQSQSDTLLFGVPAGDAMQGTFPTEWPSNAILQRHTGGCHCKKFTYEVSHPLYGQKAEGDEPVIPVTVCNCSICTHKGGMYMYVLTRHNSLPSDTHIAGVNSKLTSDRAATPHAPPPTSAFLLAISMTPLSANTNSTPSAVHTAFALCAVAISLRTCHALRLWGCRRTSLRL
jgi:hypothetical protein